jgi:hypothetical protein
MSCEPSTKQQPREELNDTLSQRKYANLREWHLKEAYIMKFEALKEILQLQNVAKNTEQTK